MNRNTSAIPFFKPSIGRGEMSAVRRILKSGWLTTGAEALAFEREFADFLRGSADEKMRTLAVNSATSGLHLALEAVGVEPGDLVAVPTLTFTATAAAIRYLGADPLFIDSDEASGNMDPQQLKKAVKHVTASGKNIKAVIPVHLGGHPCDIHAIRDALKGSDAAIIEDAAHAFPSSTTGGMVGTLGDIGVFSFYATKTITTGEGGMVSCRNPLYEDRMRLMRHHGIDRPVWNRYNSKAEKRPWEYDVSAPGYKYNMSDLAAAIGRVQLRRTNDLLTIRQRIAMEYSDELANLHGLHLPDEVEGHAWHLYIIRTDDTVIRNRIADNLRKEGIGSSVHFIPLHRMSYWKKNYHLDKNDFPVADSLAYRSLSLPLWPGLRRKERTRIVKIVRNTLHG